MAYRLGILGDTHGNAPGLARCLNFLRTQRLDGLVHLGDAVGYLPHAAAVCHMLAQSGATCLMGNHEAMLLGRLPLPEEKDRAYRLSGLGAALPAAWLRAVEANGPLRRMTLAGVSLLLCHGTPDRPLDGYGRQPDAIAVPGDVDCMLTAHTHRPHNTRQNGVLLLNPGSCGLPRDAGHLLSFAILELPAMQAEVIRIPFTPSEALLRSVHPLVRECFKREDGRAFGRVLGQDPAFVAPTGKQF